MKKQSTNRNNYQPLAQLSLFGFEEIEEGTVEETKEEEKPPVAAIPEISVASDVGRVVFSNDKISVKIKQKPSLKEPVVADTAEVVPSQPAIPTTPTIATRISRNKSTQVPQKRGRKSFKEIDAELDLIQVPDDDVLFEKQYYPISVVAGWFNVNVSLLRYWENEFDAVKPRKNRKGDRLFRPEDVKTLQTIYYLLRQQKFTVEGAKEYLKVHKKNLDVQVEVTQSLNKFRSFLLELKANL